MLSGDGLSLAESHKDIYSLQEGRLGDDIAGFAQDIAPHEHHARHCCEASRFITVMSVQPYGFACHGRTA